MYGLAPDVTLSADWPAIPALSTAATEEEALARLSALEAMHREDEMRAALDDSEEVAPW